MNFFREDGYGHLNLYFWLKQVYQVVTAGDLTVERRETIMFHCTGGGFLLAVFLNQNLMSEKLASILGKDRSIFAFLKFQLRNWESLCFCLGRKRDEI